MKSLSAFVIGLVFVPALLDIAAILGWLPSDAASEPPPDKPSIG